jgi:hypothetical protein
MGRIHVKERVSGYPLYTFVDETDLSECFACLRATHRQARRFTLSFALETRACLLADLVQVRGNYLRIIMHGRQIRMKISTIHQFLFSLADAGLS